MPIELRHCKSGRRKTTTACGPVAGFHAACLPSASRDRDSLNKLLFVAGTREEDRRPKKINAGGATMQSKAQIDQALRQKADAQEIPGVVAMAASGNEVVYQSAFGKRDLSK